jgi:hypothetical protein
MRTVYLLTAAAAVGAMAVPAVAQQAYAYPYAQPVPQPYPGQPGYGYAQPGYAQPGYAQPYGGTNVVEQIVNQLLGNNTAYTVTDRGAVSRCATAAVAQAERQYSPRYGYGNRYGYNQPANPHYGYNTAYPQMRVTAISNVERRRNNGLRVTGLINSGAYATAYGNAYGYQGQRSSDSRYADPRYADPRYAQAADLSFRCNVDSRGAVSGVRVNRYTAAYRR